MAVDGGSDHVADGPLIVGSLVQVLVAVVAAFMDAGPHFAFFVAIRAGARTKTVIGELLQVDRPAEMPRDLFFFLFVSCVFRAMIYI